MRQKPSETALIANFLRQILLLGDDIAAKVHHISFHSAKALFQEKRFLKIVLDTSQKRSYFIAGEKLDNFFDSSPLFGANKKFLVFRSSIIRNSLFAPNSGALPFDVKETGFEISGLHKAAMLRPAFYKTSPNFKS